MKIIKYDKWFVIMRNGCLGYTQEEEYASVFSIEKATILNEVVKGKLIA